MKIRNAQLSDAFKIAQIHIASWRSAYKGMVPDDYLDKLSVEKRKRGWEEIINGLDASGQCLIVAEDKGEIVSFISAGAARKYNLEFDGELYAIYSDPAYYGHGAGTILFEKCTDYLKQEGFSNFYCWVLEDNKIGRRFYERIGGEIVGNQKETVEIAGKKLQEVMYGWTL